MKKQLSFEIDKITNSIEEAGNGKKHETEIKLITLEEVKTIRKKDGWSFNWKAEFNLPGHQVYKLRVNGINIIQGLISLEPKAEDSYIEMHLIESAPHNLGKNKKFVGIPGNLVAFACKMSFELGLEGFVAFTAKTNLVEHYIKTLGACVIYGNNRMCIFTEEAKNLVNSYYKDYLYGQ
jgi:hypothetical protein